jgi:hypothetical protein
MGSRGLASPPAVMINPQAYEIPLYHFTCEYSGCRIYNSVENARVEGLLSSRSTTTEKVSRGG